LKQFKQERHRKNKQAPTLIPYANLALYKNKHFKIVSSVFNMKENVKEFKYKFYITLKYN
jgi:hypothetical protein